MEMFGLLDYCLVTVGVVWTGSWIHACKRNLWNYFIVNEFGSWKKWKRIFFRTSWILPWNVSWQWSGSICTRVDTGTSITVCCRKLCNKKNIINNLSKWIKCKNLTIRKRMKIFTIIGAGRRIHASRISKKNHFILTH